MPPTDQPLDALDRKLLQALQLDGRVPFSRVAQVLGVSDQTVARRVRRLRETAGLRVLGMTDGTRLGRTSWIVRLACAPDVAERLAGALARRPDTMYVKLVSGGTEVTCGMRPRSRRERDDLLLGRLQRTPRITSISAHCVLHEFTGGGATGWLTKIDALAPDEAAALRPPPPEPAAGPLTLDADDERLLAALHEDGRRTLTELQTATALTETAVRTRLDRLRARGVLYFDVQYDPAPLGQDVDAFLWLTVAPAHLAAAGVALAAHPQVQFAAATTGPANLAAATLHTGPAELYTYLSERVGALPGVQSVESVLSLRRVKGLAYRETRPEPDRAGSSGVAGEGR
ncbi:Lrp/AsnC family transcriptional regulator [Streptomyces sp. NPDC086091]|uniref:Lrp/AsnC family transcriptional regulator n=1 Tax=Streptomyces sp. NPDC086091 TaxID=3365751 RepID=UPI003810101D